VAVASWLMLFYLLGVDPIGLWRRRR